MHDIFLAINKRAISMWALLTTAPSVDQLIVRLVPCKIVTSDKRACGLICDTGSPNP